jgi:hypothetical protein
MSGEMDNDELCRRCGCCSLDYQQCENCGGEGYVDHDCGEDSCWCLDPEPNVPCDICGGDGGWKVCGGRCDENGHHRPAAEALEAAGQQRLFA